MTLFVFFLLIFSIHGVLPAGLSLPHLASDVLNGTVYVITTVHLGSTPVSIMGTSLTNYFDGRQCWSANCTEAICTSGHFVCKPRGGGGGGGGGKPRPKVSGAKSSGKSSSLSSTSSTSSLSTPCEKYCPITSTPDWITSRPSARSTYDSDIEHCPTASGTSSVKYCGPFSFDTTGASPPSKPSTITPSVTMLSMTTIAWTSSGSFTTSRIPSSSITLESSYDSDSITTHETEINCGLVKRASTRSSNEAQWSYCTRGTAYLTRITSIKFGNEKSVVLKTCGQSYTQACLHYRSVVSRSPQWATLTCSDFMGFSTDTWGGRTVTRIWNLHHDETWRSSKYADEKTCQRDEYPPAYFFTSADPLFLAGAQRVRLIPARQNGGAGQLWNQLCYREGLKDVNAVLIGPTATVTNVNKGKTTITSLLAASVSFRPHFSIASYALPGFAANAHGLEANPCIPKGIVDDMYYPLMHDDLEISSVQNGPKPRGSWSYDYAYPPPAQVIAQATTRP